MDLDKYNLKQPEKETVINFNDGGEDATVYTCNKALIKRLDELCHKFPELYKEKRRDEVSKTYTIPKKNITIRQPIRLSNEQRKKMEERGKAAIKNLNKFDGQTSVNL